MRKITAGILTAALALALGGATVSAVGLGQAERGAAAQDGTQERIYKNADGICAYYGDGICLGDSDGDGVCDYHEDGSCLRDADGDGVCDYHENGVCPGDSDGDGICDYRENVSAASETADGSYGCGNGWHHSNAGGSGSAHGYGHGHGCR